MSHTGAGRVPERLSAMPLKAPAEPHTRKMIRNMMSRPRSTPKRKISGSVMARVDRQTKKLAISVSGYTS